ncbi:hypothetical protein ACVWZV_009290 [Bradyrhizobium sp. GM5.1]
MVAALLRSRSVSELSAGASVRPSSSRGTTRIPSLNRSAANVEPAWCLNVSDALLCASTSITRTRRFASAMNQAKCTASVVFPAGLGNPTRRIQPTRIAMQQQRHHYPRIKRRLPKPAHIAAHDLPEIEALSHQINHKPRDMAFRHEVLHIRRQKQRLINVPRPKNTCSSPNVESDPTRFEQRLSRQAPSLPAQGGQRRPLQKFNRARDIPLGTAPHRLTPAACLGGEN